MLTPARASFESSNADGRLSRLRASFCSVRDRLEYTGFSKAAAVYSLAAIVALYLLVTALAARRLLWHDELFTFYIATAPSWSKLWQEIPLDLNPPLQFFAVRISTSLFGLGNYAVRLPTILAFLTGSLCLLAFVRNRLGASYGVLALSVFWASPFFYYATEARPYALVTGFLGLTLIAWQHAIKPDRTWLSLAVLVLCVMGMMLSHLMSIFYVAPFCIAELVRIWKTRKIDVPVWAALLFPCAIPFVFLRLMARFQEDVFPPLFQASLRRIPESYYGTLKLEALPLFIGLALALLAISARPTHARPSPVRIDPVTLSLTAGFLLSPLTVNLVLMSTHGAYFDRYAMPVEFGYALAVAYLVAAVTRQSRVGAWIASGVLLLFMAVYNLGPALKHSVWSRRTVTSRSSSLELVRPDLPLVAASGLTFIEMDHYSQPAVQDRLYYLTDRSRAIRYANATIFEGTQDEKAFFPIRSHVAPYQAFVTEHPKFLVLGTPDYPEDWLLRALLKEGFNLQYLGDFDGPYKDHQLYLVSSHSHQ